MASLISLFSDSCANNSVALQKIAQQLLRHFLRKSYCCLDGAEEWHDGNTANLQPKADSVVVFFICTIMIEINNVDGAIYIPVSIKHC